MNVLKGLFRSRKFWLAVFGVVQTVVFQFFPEFSKDVWVAIDVLIGVLIGSIAAEDAAAKLKQPWPVPPGK